MNSSRVSAAKLEELLEFTLRHLQPFPNDIISVVPQDGGYETAGLATWYGRHALVILAVAESSYPRVTRHPVLEVAEKVGEVSLMTQEEEVLFVMAHECRHVLQFRTTPCTDAIWMEIDAEKFAKKVLMAYRKNLTKAKPIDKIKSSEASNEKRVAARSGSRSSCRVS